ncbi:MAG: ssDNA-binding protein [Synechococcus sp.]
MPQNVTPLGQLAWSYIVEPRENLSGKLEWSCGFEIAEEDAQPIFAAIEEAIAEKRANDASYPKTNKDLNLPFSQAKKKLEDGSYEMVPGRLTFKFKRNTQYKGRNGEVQKNNPPALYDSQGRLCTGEVARVNPGSKGKIVYDVYCYNMATTKGVQLQMRGFQIVEMSASQELVLPPVEGGWVPEGNEEAIDVASLLQG